MTGIDRTTTGRSPVRHGDAEAELFPLTDLGVAQIVEDLPGLAEAYERTAERAVALADEGSRAPR